MEGHPQAHRAGPRRNGVKLQKVGVEIGGGKPIEIVLALRACQISVFG
jgi:hypothetical protein